MIYYFLKLFLGGIVRLFWVGEVVGKDNIPKGQPYLLAANHESYFDFLCLASIFPGRLYFLAGEVFFRKWWWWPIVKLTGQIMVDRNSNDKSESVSKVLEYLNKGRVVAIFPEGTRSADGRLGKAYTGTVSISLKAHVPILPVGIVGTYEIMSRYDKYPKPGKCKIIFGKPIYMSNYNIEGNMDDVNFLTHKVLMKEIASLTNEEYNHG